MDKWTFRRSTCKGIYTHPDITTQIVVDNQKGTIEWANLTFTSVKEAKDYAEKSL